jgi:hypothetical protein
MNINPHWIVVDIEPSIALARAECLQKYHAPSAPTAPTSDVTNDAPVARALRQFMTFLMSGLRSVRSSRYPGLHYAVDLQPSVSAAYPRGA